MSVRGWSLISAVTAALVIVGVAAAPQARAQQGPTPLTLAQAVTLALQENQQLRVAAFEVAIARAQLAQAQAAAHGQLNAQTTYTRTQEQGPTTLPVGAFTITLPPPSPNLYDARLAILYPLYTGGRLEAQIALAEANLKGAEATLARLGQQIVFGARQGYYQVLLAQSGVDVAERLTAQATENLRVARARVAAGVAPRFDEIQAVVVVANARQGLVRARNGLALASQALNAVLNLPLSTPLLLRDPFQVEAVRTPPERLVATAVQTRPEVAEVQARQAAAQASIVLAESGARPTLALSGFSSYGNTGAQFGGGASASTNWGLTLAATLNLYDGGFTQERIREVQLRLEQLKAIEAQQRQTIEQEVSQALLNLQSAGEELGGADALVAQAAEALRIANVRFQSGVGTGLEVASALTAASQAEAGKAQALFNYSLARAALERAVGGPVP